MSVKRDKSGFPLGVLLFAWVAIFAALTGSAATTITSITVTDVSIYNGLNGGTGAYVLFTPVISGTVEGCSQSPVNEVWIDFAAQTTPDGKSLYATVLAAYLAGRKLTFGVSGCGASGQVPLVYRVDVQ